MPALVVTLYSRSAPIIKATTDSMAEVGILVQVNAGPPPPSASFVVSNKGETREMTVMSHRLRARVVLMPEHALFVSSSARSHAGCVLVGADHQLSQPTPDEGALF